MQDSLSILLELGNCWERWVAVKHNLNKNALIGHSDIS